MRPGLVVAMCLCLCACGGPSSSSDASTELLTGEAAGGPGLWPQDAVKNYTTSFALGSVQSVGFDDAQNLWLLDGERIGVLRPSDKAPKWSTGIGQAAGGFGQSKLALGSTVICGGGAGQAYVGYQTYELTNVELGDVNHAEYQKGDVDVVSVDGDGKVTLKTHLSESAVYAGQAQNKLGIRNSNDWRYDEDRSVLVCRKLRKGARAGDVFIGTNHGVTMIRGTTYNSHRHPVWDVNGSLRIGFNFALGASFDGKEVLMGNEWKLGILAAPAELKEWDRSVENPWILDTYADSVNSMEAMDYWRGFTQTKSGAYFLSSDRFGLWKMTRRGAGQQPSFEKISGVPDGLTKVEATNDGSLFIGTKNDGLWRMSAEGAVSKVKDVNGAEVRELLYEPALSPPMLFVLTDSALTVLRSH